jgi:hypothetical protein
MKNNRLISYSAILLSAMLLIGCETANRLDVQSVKDNTPNTGGEFINDDKNSTSDEFINDNNSTGNHPGSIPSEDDNATTGTIKIDAKNAYKVSVKFSDDYNDKGYYSKNEVGELKFDIKNIYTGESIEAESVKKITLKTEELDPDNSTQGKYLNFITFSGAQGGIYEIEKNYVKASDSVAVKMGELSGTTNIILEVYLENFDDPFKLKVPIVIEKNGSSSMAIVQIGSRYENGLFIDKFVIHVVDSYGNKADDGTNISTGVINNPKLYSNAYNGATQSKANNYIIDINDTQTYTTIQLNDQTLPKNPYEGKVIGYDIDKYLEKITLTYVDENNQTVSTTRFQDKYYANIYNVLYKNDKANLNRSNGTFTINPLNATDIINNDITQLDTLIILANKNQHKPENLGGWDIKSVNSNTELSLVSLDSGTDISGVSYVIGDEYRYIDYGQTIINAAASTFETTQVKDGLAFAELRYTPEMVGKNIFIYANSRLENKHIGISRKILLHGTGLKQQTLSCTNDRGTKPDCSMSIRIVQNDSGKGAHRVNIAHPQIAGPAVYRYTTASQTNDTGWTTVSIYGIDENKTATVSFGSLINDEYTLNQK